MVIHSVPSAAATSPVMPWMAASAYVSTTIRSPVSPVGAPAWSVVAVQRLTRSTPLAPVPAPVFCTARAV